ncbi:MAG: putative cytokinetic ring protein SteA [Acidimicrobiales bacterium]
MTAAATPRIPAAGPGEVRGPARVDRLTKRLIHRLQPGDVAVIDHLDLDRIAAEGLVRARPAAVVNAARSISGRYPNVGPLLLAAAGIPLVDDVGRELLEGLSDGDRVRVEQSEVWVEGRHLASGTRHTLESLEAQLEAAKAGVGEELERFAANTLEHLRRERHLLSDSPDLPQLRTELAGRHVLVVVRGSGHRDDLAHLRSSGYIRELRPVLVGVDGGADALLDCGLRPDIIIGDFDSVSPDALATGAELVVHAYPGGAAPGAARLDELGRPYQLFEAIGTSEDIALLLAYESGAQLIVAVGSHASMVDFLDKGRGGMAATFHVRLKVGPILVDAKGVNRLYASRVRKSDLTYLIAAALFAVLVMVLVSEPLRLFLHSVWLELRHTWA